MDPILLDLPLPGGLHLPIGAYGALLVAGMLAAAWASGRHGGRLGLSRLDAFDLGLWLLAAGVIGAHLLYVAAHPESYFGGAGGWSASLRRGGLAYYGGLAAAVPVLWLWSRRRGVPLLDLADFVAPLGALGLAITRIGCFLNGCCFGAPTDLPWAVVFPPGSLPQQAQAAIGLAPADAPSLPVHPVQLYELAAALAIFALLQRRFPRRRRAGEIAVAFFIAYGTWRFAVEWLRADGAGWRPDAHGLTLYQLLSLAVIGAALAAGWALRRAGRPAWAGNRAVSELPPAAAETAL